VYGATVDWECGWVGRYKKYTQNFGAESSSKTTSWKTERERWKDAMNTDAVRDMVVRLGVLPILFSSRLFFRGVQFSGSVYYVRVDTIFREMR
jgi:hypothetical protein